MQKLARLGGVAVLALATILVASGHAADRPGPTADASNPMAEIADMYAWITGTNLNLVMDLSRFDDGAHSFDPSVLYVFHLTSKPGLGVAAPGGAETRVVLRFASSTSVECWVTDGSGVTTKDYVSGDPSAVAGVRSVDGKVRVFAGPRSDPSFFNATNLGNAVVALANDLTNKDAAGCPAILDAEATRIRNILTATGSDTFAAANVMAIVVQVEKSLVNVDSNRVVAVWGSTHAGS